MFTIVSVTPKFAIGPQPSAVDFDRIRTAGFASILNTRPDDEDGYYLRSKEAEISARSRGIAYAYSPSENYALFETPVIDQFEHALTVLPSPIFAHCKTGTRAAILWALVAARYREVEDVISELRSAGHELEFFEDELRESSRTADRSPLRLKDDTLLSLSRSTLLGDKEVN